MNQLEEAVWRRARADQILEADIEDHRAGRCACVLADHPFECVAAYYLRGEIVPASIVGNPANYQGG